MKPHRLRAAALAVGLFFTVAAAEAQRICWVSDLLPINSGTTDRAGTLPDGIFGPGAGPYADQGFVNLLTTAGYTVDRYNPPDSGNVLSANDINLLNGYDLIVLTRSLNSGAFDAAVEVTPWNTQITKPILSTNVFLVRRVRLGWFVGTTGNGETGGNVYNTALTFANPSDPVSAYLIGDTTMSGASTQNSMYKQITTFTNPDRGQNFMVNSHTVASGGSILATAVINGGYAIATLPAGTTVTPLGNVNQVLSGFRMLCTVGNQEPGTAPENVVGNAGFNNLEPEMEQMFLRAVTVAINNGSVPAGVLPPLELNLTTTDAILSWNAPGWVLESSSSMQNGLWDLQIGSSPLSLPRVPTQQFFRLRYAP